MSNPNPGASGGKPRRGCVFYGCLSLTVITLLLALCVSLGLYFGKRFYDGLIQDFTSTTPEKLEEVQYPEPLMRGLQARLAAFRQTMDKNAIDGGELVLTADDLNALISRNPELKGKLFVRIEDDQIKGQVSVPLKDLGPFKLKGRYLNGAASFKVALREGRLEARVDQVSVRDQPLPPLFLNEIKKQDLAREMQSDPESARVISRLEQIEIRDGKVHLRSKSGPGNAGPAAPAQP